MTKKRASHTHARMHAQAHTQPFTHARTHGRLGRMTTGGASVWSSSTTCTTSPRPRTTRPFTCSSRSSPATRSPGERPSQKTNRPARRLGERASECWVLVFGFVLFVCLFVCVLGFLCFVCDLVQLFFWRGKKSAGGCGAWRGWHLTRSGLCCIAHCSPSPSPCLVGDDAADADDDGDDDDGDDAATPAAGCVCVPAKCSTSTSALRGSRTTCLTCATRSAAPRTAGSASGPSARAPPCTSTRSPPTVGKRAGR